MDTSQQTNNLTDRILVNLKKWSENSTVEESMSILETHTQLITDYQALDNFDFLTDEKNKLELIINTSKLLLNSLEKERSYLFERISQMNDSGKIASQYIKQFSESYFIDKDF